ncbi:uncharacterized protein [Chelonus insularis]|uniref:uncharacterized protein isoform X2 n=1 Tax=Chelonus insularis TaxID=460826 RepID=UPI001589D322|nr:uncharacterized protein LOC118074858 isoform X2 [Chelonus insularis]
MIIIHNLFNMWSNTATFITIVIIVNCLTSSFAHNCWSKFCHNTTKNLPEEGLKCLLSPIQQDAKCANLKLFNPGHIPLKGVTPNDVKLSAYVAQFPKYHLELTAFNFSIKNTDFYKLTTRYQDIGNPKQSHCRYFQLSGHNETVELPELFVSCIFSNSSFEGQPYRLEYLISGDSYEYSRKFVFKVPHHLSIHESVEDIKSFIPFFYVDVSEANAFNLFIQKVPEKFNVTFYKVWLINNDTNTTTIVTLSAENSKADMHLSYVFPVEEGVHYFKVAAIHQGCGDYGCVNSTSPAINTKFPTRRLLIMIVSVVWIPPVILYAIYYIYKLYRKRDLLKRINKKPNCFLVYSPTHLAHVNVITSLAKYLKSCNINTMVDQLDIPESDTKDPGLWCNRAFKSADVIIVASSPPLTDTKVPVIYQNMDNHALKLIKDNFAHRNKRYAAVEFAYCKPDDIPEEAQVFKRFRLPDNLEKLVRFIYNIEQIRFFDTSSEELIDNIAIAMMTILHERPNSSKNDLLPVSMNPLIIKENECFITKKLSSDNLSFNNIRNYTTKLDDLSLLGENSKIHADNNEYESHKCNGEFCINELDL